MAGTGRARISVTATPSPRVSVTPATREARISVGVPRTVRIRVTAGGSGSGITQLTGDVTAGPASGSAVATIAAAAVTLAKIANALANSKLLGSGATGIGAPYEEITLGSNLSMVGSTLNAAAGVTLKTNGTNNGSQVILNLIGGSNVTLTDDGVGGITIALTGSGTGDVVGPGAAVDDTIVVFDGGTGKIIKNTGVTLPGYVNISQAESNSGITPAADGIYPSPSSITIVDGIITAIS